MANEALGWKEIQNLEKMEGLDHRRWVVGPLDLTQKFDWRVQIAPNIEENNEELAAPRWHMTCHIQSLTHIAPWLKENWGQHNPFWWRADLNSSWVFTWVINIVPCQHLSPVASRHISILLTSLVRRISAPSMLQIAPRVPPDLIFIFQFFLFSRTSKIN